MKFKNTEYGDLTNQSIKNSINVKSKFLTSLEGCPKKVNGNFDCYHNKLTSLEYSPEIVNGLFFCSYNKLKILKGNVKEINGVFNCENNPNLKNVREEIIKYGIKANYYETDYGFFDFKDIEEEFNNSYLKHKKILYVLIINYNH